MRELFLSKESHMSHFSISHLYIGIISHVREDSLMTLLTVNPMKESFYDCRHPQIPHQVPWNMYTWQKQIANHSDASSPFIVENCQRINFLPTKGLYFPDTLQVRGGHNNTGFWTMKCDRKWCSAFTRPASQNFHVSPSSMSFFLSTHWKGDSA